PRRKVILAYERAHQDRRAKHLVVGDAVGEHRAKADQRVREDRQRLAGLTADAVIKPFCALLAYLIEFDHLSVESCVVGGSQVHDGAIAGGVGSMYRNTSQSWSNSSACTGVIRPPLSARRTASMSDCINWARSAAHHSSASRYAMRSSQTVAS